MKSFMKKYLKIDTPAKVNLFLNVVGKRPDGYHEIETIFHAITLFDTIFLSKSQKKGIQIECNEPSLPTDEGNLAHQAAKALSDYVRVVPAVMIKIHKRIPIGSGLGGGSSDAAATLIGLARLWNLGLGRDELYEIARGLGADVPFFILGGTALGRGIGDRLTPIETPEIHLVLIVPKFSISTREVYKRLKFRLTKEVLDISIISDCVKKGDLSKLSRHLYNVLEEVSLKDYPYLQKLKERLNFAGALSSLMTGSGPAIFGLAPSREEAYKIKDRLKDIGELVCVVSSFSSQVGVEDFEPPLFPLSSRRGD